MFLCVPLMFSLINLFTNYFNGSHLNTQINFESRRLRNTQANLNGGTGRFAPSWLKLTHPSCSEIIINKILIYLHQIQIIFPFSNNFTPFIILSSVFVAGFLQKTLIFQRHTRHFFSPLPNALSSKEHRGAIKLKAAT